MLRFLARSSVCISNHRVRHVSFAKAYRFPSWSCEAGVRLKLLAVLLSRPSFSVIRRPECDSRAVGSFMTGEFDIFVVSLSVMTLICKTGCALPLRRNNEDIETSLPCPDLNKYVIFVAWNILSTDLCRHVATLATQPRKHTLGAEQIRDVLSRKKVNSPRPKTNDCATCTPLQHVLGQQARAARF